MHEETYIPKLEPNTREEKLVEHSHDSVASRVYKPTPYRDAKRRNVTYIEPPPYKITSPSALTTGNDSYQGDIFNLARLIQYFGTKCVSPQELQTRSCEELGTEMRGEDEIIAQKETLEHEKIRNKEEPLLKQAQPVLQSSTRRAGVTRLPGNRFHAWVGRLAAHRSWHLSSGNGFLKVGKASALLSFRVHGAGSRTRLGVR